MSRLPYGSYKLMTPEQQIAHNRMLAARYRKKNKDRLRLYNKKYFDEWKKTLPFECVCATCGATFNACRANRYMCPDCHKRRKQHWIDCHNKSQENLQKRLKLEKEVIKLYNSGMLQKDIARKFNITQSAISYICRIHGFYRGKQQSKN